MKVRIKVRVKSYGIYYDVQYRLIPFVWRHYTRCTKKEDAIEIAKNLEKIPRIYSSWQELAAQENKTERNQSDDTLSGVESSYGNGNGA